MGAIGFALLLVLGSAGASFAQGTPADLTATPSAITVTVLAQHRSQPVSVMIIASHPIPTTGKLAAAMLGDLVRDDSAARVPSSDVPVSVKRDTTDSTNESFVLTLRPSLSGADPGKYSGNVRVTGPNVNALVVPVTMSIQGGSWLEALGLLLLGLLVGWLLKWYTDVGSKLAAETHRYNSVLRKIGDTPTANMPKFLRDELDDVTQGFNDADQAKADAALTLLEGQVAGLAAVTDAAGHLRESIVVHADEVQRQGLRFRQIPVNERRRLNDALNEATDLPTAKSAVSDLLRHAIAITTCLQVAADQGHADVLSQYDRDLFAGALNAFQNLPAPPAAPPAGPPAAGVAPALGSGAADPARLQSLLLNGMHLQEVLAAPAGAVPPAPPTGPPGVAAPRPGWRTRPGAARRVFLGWLPLIMGVVTVVVIALIGLKTQWSSNVTFGSGGVIDDVALFLWGVAAFVTGKTLSDFLGTMVTH